MHAADSRGIQPIAAGDARLSIVINTDGRAASLGTTLESLVWLDGPEFEVCVVAGPTPDGTEAVLKRWSTSIKIARCAERNLSVSRNLGIGLAAGEIVAFLDDDAVPEPEWLRELAVAYLDSTVGGAGGFVHSPDGVTYQYRFGTVDRLGRAELSWERATPEFNFPFSANVPHLLGTNSSFRRDALIGIRGFDEEFEYYLDETDVACRLVDAGWRIAQIEGAHVHHKFLESADRNTERVLTNWYPVLKNRIYFGLVNGLLHHSINTVIKEAQAFIDGFAHDVDWAISVGRLTERDRTRFWQDVERAWRDGLVRGFAGRRRLPEQARLKSPPPFRAFRTHVPQDGRRCFCFISREFPPGSVGGIGRYTHVVARNVATLGHQVHVVTASANHDRVDYEAGIWVHRVLPTDEDYRHAAVLGLPEGIGGHAARVARELVGIGARRPVAAACAPIWDCEGLGVLAEGKIPLVLSLHTPLHAWLDSHNERRGDQDFMVRFIEPVLAAERRLLLGANGVIANSRGIVTEISRTYGVELSAQRLGIIPHGLEDWTTLPLMRPDTLPSGSIRLLFVGRLEKRKGIDVLLTAAKRVMARYQTVQLELIGNDTPGGPHGATWRETFEADSAADEIRGRVRFHGEVNEASLRGWYSACDILVVPSRFESFGLTLIEGMMFGRPVIGCRAGGMVEVVEDGVSGLLAEPGNVASLEDCLERLIRDPALRARLGSAARSQFESHFTADRMARETTAFLSRLADAQHSNVGIDAV